MENRVEHFVAVGIEAMSGFEVVEVGAGVPPFTVDRLEVYDDSGLFDVEVFVRSDQGALRSLFGTRGPCAAGAFRPGNTAHFNAEGISGLEVVVKVTSLASIVRRFRGALFGKARTT